MLLHSTRTVLAAIICTILLHDSTKGAIPKVAGHRGLVKNSIWLFRRESTSRNSIQANKIDTIEHERPNVETRSSDEAADGQIVSRNDMVVEARKDAVQKSHVKQNRYLSLETSSISTANEKTNGGAYSEVVKYEGKYNDAESIVEPHFKAPAVALQRENNIVARSDTGDEDAFRYHGSNVSKAVKRIEMKNYAVPNGTSSKDIASHAKEVSNFTRTRATKVSTIGSSNTSDAILQDRNPSLKTRGFEYHNSTNETAAQGSSIEEEGFAYHSSFTGDSWKVDRTFEDGAAAFQEDQRTKHHEDLPSGKPPETLSSFNTGAEHVGEWKSTREKLPARNTGFSISNPKTWQEKTFSDIAGKMRGAQVSPGTLGIFQFVEKAKSTLSRRRQDPTTASSCDQVTNEYETKGYALKVKRSQGKKENSETSDSSLISANLLGTKTNHLSPDTSEDHTSVPFTTARESLGVSSKGLSGLVELPGNLGHEADSPREKTDEGWDKDTARHLIVCYLHPGALSESERLKKLLSSYTKEPYRRREHERKLRRMYSNLGYEENVGRDLVVSLLDKTSERNSGKTRITDKNNDRSKMISEERNIIDMWNNTEFRLTTPASLDNGVSRRIREYVDNPNTETRVHGNVVNTKLTGFQKDRGAHKTFIGQKYVDDIMAESYQKEKGQVQVQESKKYGEKLIPDKRAMDTDESPLGQKDEGTVSRQKPLVNSTAFSWFLVKRDNNRLDSITDEIGDDVTRKMELSGGEQNSRDSRKIRISRDDLTRGGVMFSKVFREIEPRSVQFLRATATESDASGDHDVPIGRENFILKIFQTTRTEASSSLDSSLAQVHPWDFASDRDENGHRNDQQRGTSVILGTPRSQAQLGKNIHESLQVDKLRKISSVIGIIDASEVHPGNQRQRGNQSVNDSRSNSAGKNSQAAPTDTKTVRPPTAVINESKQLRNQRRLIESSIGQGIYIGKSKIDGTNDTSVVNGSEFLNSNKSDFPTSRRVSRNNGNEVISNANICETCEVAGNPDKEGNGELVKFILAGRQGISGRKMASSISDKRTLESSLRNEEKRGNGDLFDPRVVNVDDSSMAEVQSKREERQGKRVRRENGGAVALGQVRITTGHPDRNLIVVEKRLSSKRGSLPKIEKFRATDERDVSTGETFDQGIETSSFSGNVLQPRLFVSTEPELTSIDKKLHSNLSKFSGRLVVQSSNEFSDNANDISWDPKNLELHSNSPTESSLIIAGSSMSPDDENLVQKPPTISSMKIDSSVRSIDRPYDPRVSLRRQKFSEASHIWSDGNTDVAKNFNARAKQMKRGFMSRDTGSFFIAEATTVASYQNYRATVATETGELRNASSVDLIDDHPRTMEPNDNQLDFSKISILSSTDSTSSPSGPSGSYQATLKPFIATFSSSNPIDIKDPITHRPHQATRNKLAPASLTDLTNVATWTTDRSNPNHELNFSISDTNTSNLISRQSDSFEQSPGKPYYEGVEKSADARTPNVTMQDNATRPTATLNQWPVKHSAVVEGDLVLGGLMMVHEREDSVTCGPVMPQGGVQALEAMLYTLDWLNERNLVPGVKIGAHILDDCDKDTYGLEMAVDFIKGSISNIDGAEYHCNKTAVRKVISGVVGAASSVTSIQVANLLRLFRIPQVSFFSTSPELSNKMRFEYFTRTIPSDHYQVKAMVDIVLVMGWSYVSIIYEESNYGEKAYEELEKLLGKHQICIAVKEKLSKDSGVAEAYVYDNIVQKLLTKPRARGCIIFASDQEVAGVMRAVRRCNATGAFSWIGSDGWSARSLVSDGNEREMEGTLSVQPQANPVEGFEDYFLNLTVENNRRNPWFVEFWEDHFKCRYPNSSKTPYNNYTQECTTTERLTRENTAFEDQLQFVSDAVLAFAHAFRNMHSQLCHGKPGLCDAMKPTKGTELLNYLRTVEFDGLSGDVFHFDKNGDGPARYNIIHFKQISPGEYKWIRVGKYLEGELRLNMSEIQFRLGHPEAPESVCSLPCEVGQAKKYVEGESCCWHCFNCSQDEIRHLSDEKQCVLCPKGTLPDETHSYCRDIPEEFLRPESGWAIGAMSFSSTGILITLFVGGVFLKHNDTPIVRASGRELSYVLLTGILLCYLVTFALVLRPTDIVCSIQRFSAGFCFTVMYAALLTKTNRISRIFNAGKRSAKRPSFISPRSQLIICSMLVAVQILINAVWMVIDPAKARHHYPTREDNLLVCNSYIDASYMIAFTYPIILIVVCTVYAVLTRKIPEAFNESKHIGFTMYTTCVIWLAFVPLYFATGSHVALRITSMSVTISLSATVTIACLFTPKLYIILIHPERNVRPNMMHHRYNTTKGSVVTATNASSMMAPVTLTAVTCDQNKAVKKHAVTTTDCSTQSELLEIELKERINGKLPASMTSRSTQTSMNNNGKETCTKPSPIIKDIAIEENMVAAKGLNIGKIGNGPLSQNEVPL